LFWLREKGWKFAFVQPRTYVIPAGVGQFAQTYDSKLSYKEPISGYILGIGASSNQPTTQLEVFHTGPQNQHRILTGSPFSINAMGLQYPNPTGFWFGTYAVGNYTAFYMPFSRLGFFNEYLRIRILGIAGAVSVVSYYHTIVEVFNENDFRKSWRRLWQNDTFKIKELKED